MDHVCARLLLNDAFSITAPIQGMIHPLRAVYYEDVVDDNDVAFMAVILEFSFHIFVRVGGGDVGSARLPA
jgi:hypothetical protein